MNLLKLYIKDFMCYSTAEIDFTQFQSVLIVGKVNNSLDDSNGAGKSTIFKAIEYVLFNESDIPFENIVRDDTEKCVVAIDIEVESVIYRIERKRNKKKNSSDLNLYQLIDKDSTYSNLESSSDKAIWKNISSRTSTQTEKDVAKLIKINFKAFRSTLYFIQGYDTTSLVNLTPEKRKQVVRDALELSLYSKLEKIAKEKIQFISKEINEKKVILSTLSTTEEDLVKLKIDLVETNENLDKNKSNLELESTNLNKLNIDIKNTNDSLLKLEENSNSLKINEKSINEDLIVLNKNLQNLTKKKNDLLEVSKAQIEKAKTIKLSLEKLEEKDLNFSDKTESLTKLKEIGVSLNINLRNLLTESEELKIPLPKDANCKVCRQDLTEEHRIQCQKDIDEKFEKTKSQIIKTKSDINSNNELINKIENEIKVINFTINEKVKLNNSLEVIQKDIENNKNNYSEYISYIKDAKSQIEEKTNKLNEIKLKIENNKTEELTSLLKEKDKLLLKLSEQNSLNLGLNKQISHFTSQKAVIENNLSKKEKDLEKITILKPAIDDLEKSIKIHNKVSKAFSSSGIPNLIIQSVLDDWMAESNLIISQLMQGLQLEFRTEKTKDDGNQDDTLEIVYFINGKERLYSQLSGAQKLIIGVGLKLGFKFVLKKLVGSDISLLLFDEVDQAMDKNKRQTFVDIVKHLQKEYTIMTITHDDRYKDKFSKAILVEQDTNLISTAKLVSSW